jgi:mono/diheme cytochrome c family protein
LARAGLVALALLCLLVGGGWTTRHDPAANDLAKGRRLFQAGKPQSCGFCHTLSAAATTGSFGPDLDGEMQEPERRSLTVAQLARVVRNYIANGDCLDSTDPTRCMPPGLFSGDDAAAVATFVAVCGRTPSHAGCAPAAGPRSGAALRGEQLFRTRGCASCHFSVGGRSTGPPLIGVAGSTVQLVDGRRVRADRGYLAGSISDPDRQVVLGYASGIMSAWVAQQHLSRGEIAALVSYLESLK